MTAPRSVYGQLLDDLVTRLTQHAESDLVPRARAFIAFQGIASTPCMWPLDDILFEMLLTATGLDLSDVEHLHAAHWATTLLVAGDPSYDGLWCGHGDTPSILCDLRGDLESDEQYGQVMDLAASGAFDAIYDLRRGRCEDYGIDDTGPDGLSDAA